MNIVRARAVESQTIRIVYDVEPTHFSPAGYTDALNPVNYAVTITSGTGTAPRVVGVKEDMLTNPAAVVEPGTERGFDVQVDRALIADLVYRITVQRVTIKGTTTAIGAPAFAGFAGKYSFARAPVEPKVQGNVDVETSLVTGTFVIDGSGDLSTQPVIESLRKRISRRVLTPQNAYAFLPGYGVGLILKKPASIAALSAVRADIIQQVRLEPEVEDVKVTASMQNGVTTFDIRATVKTGQLAQVGVTVNPAGGVTIT